MKPYFLIPLAILLFFGCQSPVSSPVPETLYQVIYLANGATEGKVPEDAGSYASGAVVTVRPQGGLVRQGYTFDSWNTAPDGQGTRRDPGTSFSVAKATVLLYAKWRPLALEVSFDANGGTGSMAVATGNVEGSVTLPRNTFQRSGYVFKSWNTSRDEDGQAWSDQATVPLGFSGFVLYAQWMAAANVLGFAANGGTGAMADRKVETGTSLVLPDSVFTRDGYRFAGWNTKADGKGVAYLPGDTLVMGPTSFILYARWTAQGNTIRYFANGGEGTMADQTATTDASVVLPPSTFTRDGYTFIGWNTKVDRSGVDYAPGDTLVMGPSSLNLYARWAAQGNSIRYFANGGTGSIADQMAVTDSSVTLATSGLSRAGYALAGWNTKADLTGTAYAPGDTLLMGPTSLNLYARWVAQGHAIHYFVNGGTGALADQTAATDATVTLAISGFSRAGYTFAGWNTKADLTGTAYAPGAQLKMGAVSVSLYARWTAQSHDIQYSANGGTGAVSSQTAATDATVTLATSGFFRAGYSFAGWNTKADLTGSAYAPGETLVMGPASLSLYARWAAQGNAILYFANGGTGAMADQAAATDSSVTLGTSGFSRAGYSFAGWNTKADLTGTVYAPGETLVMGPTSLNLYARWTAESSSIRYFPNGGAGSITDQTVVTDASVTLATSGFSRAGYSFAGWNTKADLAGTTYAPGDTLVMAPTSLNLYARWTAQSNTIRYFANGGAGSIADQAVVTDASVTLATSGLSRVGYTFAGWNTKADLTGTSFSPGGTLVMGPAGLDLYARWEADIHQIHFHPNGGTGTLADQPVATAGNVLLRTNTFTLAGHTFLGWSDNASETSPTLADGAPFTGGTADTSLYAVWAVNQYTLTFHSGGGPDTPAPVVAGYGTSRVLPSLSWTGHTFTGWNTQSDGLGTTYGSGTSYAMGAGDVTLYARWTVNLYSLVYQANGGTGSQFSQSVAYAASATVSSNPFSLTGYTFDGWNTRVDGTGTTYASGSTLVMGDGNIVLFARWKEISTSLFYSANGGGGFLSSHSGPYGSTVGLRTNTITRTGYTFTGWNTLSDGSGTAFADKAIWTFGLANQTLYAQWSPNQNTLSFEPNGASGTQAALQLSTNQTGTLPAATFTKTDFVFRGWNTDPSGMGTQYTAGASYTMGTANATLYALWGAQVSYDGSGAETGTVPATTVYPATASLTLPGPGTLTKAGFQFAGWMTKADGTGVSAAVGGSVTLASGSRTYFAVWVPQTLVIATTPTTITVTGFNASLTGSLAIPPGVTGIGATAFYNSSLTAVSIPASVSSIGIQPFARSMNLTSLTVDSANPYFSSVDDLLLDKAGTTVLQGPLGKAGLVIIPYGVTKISNSTFSGARLTTLSLPTTLREIGQQAFWNCGSLMSLTLPSGLQTIGYAAFDVANSLTSVTIPATVTSLGAQAFGYSRMLTSITVEPGCPVAQSIDGVLFDATGTRLMTFPGGRSGTYTVPAGVKTIDSRAFYYNFFITGVALNEGLTTVGVEAFQGCSELTTLTLPSTVTLVDRGAFQACSKVVSVTALPTVPPTLKSLSFYGLAAGARIHVPTESLAAYQAATEWNTYSAAIVTP